MGHTPLSPIVTTSFAGPDIGNALTFQNAYMMMFAMVIIIAAVISSAWDYRMAQAGDYPQGCFADLEDAQNFYRRKLWIASAMPVVMMVVYLLASYINPGTFSLVGLTN